MFHMRKMQEKNINIRPHFGHFWETFAKILPQIYMSAYIFTRPLLSYAAEESASWYHWRMVASLGPNSQRHSISDRTVNTGALLIAQIHGYLLGLKSIKTVRSLSVSFFIEKEPHSGGGESCRLQEAELI
jgi:hypothetical protein